MSGLRAAIEVTRGGHFTVDVEIAVGPGRTVALLGPNGSGKSTVVHALAGLLPLEGGRIELDGRTLDEPGRETFVPPEDRNIGVVFQEYLLFPHMSVTENLSFGLRSKGIHSDEALAAASVWLAKLGIEPLADRKARDLSGGQAQKAALARALITAPELLLLDEPMSALDATTRIDVRRQLADQLAAFEGPRLLITHDPTEAFLLADEIYVIEDGSITQSGVADDIRLRPRTPFVADLAGANLLAGEAADGVVDLGGHSLQTADSGLTGPVLATIHPRAISVHRQRPEGSPRNVWETNLIRIENFGDRVRIQTGDPVALTVEVTPGAVEGLGLEAGQRVWISIKATEIGVQAR